jgi:hypothetical protein
MRAVRARIRPFADSDLLEIVELLLVAWEPIFVSFEKVLGPSIFSILYPDWRKMPASLARRRPRTTAS